MSGCFAGLRLVTAGKLQHSHSYYAMVVPRHGGEWLPLSADSLAVADAVVVPPGAVGLAERHPVLRDACIAALRRSGSCELVLEQFLTDSIQERRRLLRSEVAALRLPVHASQYRAWGLDPPSSPLQQRSVAAPRPVTMMDEEELLKLSMKGVLRRVEAEAATQLQAAVHDAGAAEAGVRSCDVAVIDAPGDADVVALHGGKRPSGEDVSFYASQQAAFNEELRAATVAAGVGLTDAVTELLRQLERCEDAVTARSSEGDEANAEYAAQYAPPAPVAVTSELIERDWGLNVRTGALGLSFPLRSAQLAPLVDALAELLEAVPAAARKEDLLRRASSVWESYCPWREGRPGPLDDDADLPQPKRDRLGRADLEPPQRDTYPPRDVLAAAELLHGDAFAFLKHTKLQQIDVTLQPLHRQLAASDAARREALDGEDYASAERHHADAVAAVDAMLELCYQREAEVEFARRDVEQYLFRLTDFRENARRTLAQWRAEKEQLSRSLSDDADTIAQRMMRLEADGARARQEHSEKVADNAAALQRNRDATQTVFGALRSGVADLAALGRQRAELLADAAALTEQEALRRRREEAVRLAATPHDKQLRQLHEHTRIALDALGQMDAYYDQVSRRAEQRDVEAEREAVAHKEHLRHLSAFERYCTLACDLLTAYTARAHARGVQQRSLDLELQLAATTLDPLTRRKQQEAGVSRAESGTLSRVTEALRNRIIHHTERFKSVEPALQKVGASYSPPYLTLRDQCAKKESSALQAIHDYVDREQTHNASLSTQLRSMQARTQLAIQSAKAAGSGPPLQDP